MGRKRQVEWTDKHVDIVVTDTALKFIRSKRLKEPLVLVNLGSRSGGGGWEGDSGCGGGGSGSSTTTACANVIMVDGGNPGADFVKVDTQAGIPVYLSKAVFNVAKMSGNPLFISAKGRVVKRLILEGLDVSAAGDHTTKHGPDCH